MSERHVQAAKLRLRGLSHKEIADALLLSPQSVRTYIRHGYRCLRDLGETGVPAKRGSRHPCQTLRGNRTVTFPSMAGGQVTLTWETHEERIEVIRRLFAEGFNLKFVAWKLGLTSSYLCKLIHAHPALQDVRPDKPVVYKNAKTLKISSETHDLLVQYAQSRHVPLHRAIHYLVEQASQKS